MGRPLPHHGGFTYLTTGKLPYHRGYILRYLSDCREGLVRDLGPKEEDLTTAQIIMIDRIIGKLGCLRCIEEAIREHGVMAGRDLARPLKVSYLQYSNSLRFDLQALGINKRKVSEEKWVAPWDDQPEKPAQVPGGAEKAQPGGAAQADSTQDPEDKGGEHD